MASKYETLETLLVARIKAQVPAFAAVAPVASLELLGTGTYPRCEVVWTETLVVESGSTMARMYVTEELKFLVYIFAKDSGVQPGTARLGTNGAYDLRDQVRKALLGYEPPIANTDCIFPIEPDAGTETPFQIENGAYGIASRYKLKVSSYEGQ